MGGASQDWGKVVHAEEQYVQKTDNSEVLKIYKNKSDGLWYYKNHLGQSFSFNPGKTYKTYKALISQDATNNPTAKILENDLGNITWEYLGVGVYRIILPFAFNLDKSYIMFGGGDTNAFGSFSWAKETGDPNEVKFYFTQTSSNSPENTLLSNTAFEFSVYN